MKPLVHVIFVRYLNCFQFARRTNNFRLTNIKSIGVRYICIVQSSSCSPISSRNCDTVRFGPEPPPEAGRSRLHRTLIKQSDECALNKHIYLSWRLTERIKHPFLSGSSSASHVSSGFTNFGQEFCGRTIQHRTLKGPSTKQAKLIPWHYDSGESNTGLGYTLL